MRSAEPGGRLDPGGRRSVAREDGRSAVGESILASSEIRTTALEDRVTALEREVEQLREDIRALAASVREQTGPAE